MAKHNQNSGPRRLTVAQLEQRLACTKQTIWRWYTKGSFPKPHYLGQNRVWFESDVESWEEKQMATRTTPPAVGKSAAA
jgi:predicted DNA-binding transcriptional regulator AlpA